MPWFCESLKHQELVQLKSGVLQEKFVDSLGMSHSLVAHMRREIIGEIEKQKGRRPKVLGEQEKLLGVYQPKATTLTCVLVRMVTLRLILE